MQVKFIQLISNTFQLHVFKYTFLQNCKNLQVALLFITFLRKGENRKVMNSKGLYKVIIM